MKALLFVTIVAITQILLGSQRILAQDNVMVRNVPFGQGVQVTSTDSSNSLRIDSVVAASNLRSKVAVTYPPLAGAARVQGVVLLELIINKEGRVVDLKVVKGHPLLNDAALESVRQWQYKPHEENGEPVQVTTTVTINFVLVVPKSIPPGSASVTGRILRADGSPAAGVAVDVALPVDTQASAVSVESFTENAGEYRIQAAASPLLRVGSRTDSLGEYRIEGIGPGSYRVTASVGAQVIYYPGTSRDQAVSVAVDSNQTVLVGIDFSIP